MSEKLTSDRIRQFVSEKRLWKENPHVSKLRVSRRRLAFMLERGFGKEQPVFLEKEFGIPYHVSITPKKMPESFGGKMGFRLEWFAVCIHGINFYGSTSALMRELYDDWGIVSVP